MNGSAFKVFALTDAGSTKGQTTTMLRDLMARVGAYTDNPDPLAKIAGTVALVVASNQPFYPLYLYFIVGYAAWPAWFTLLTTPVFAAVPWLARRHSLAGRALLPIIGVVNTMLCVKLIGAKTGVELFLLPCVLLAAILFRPAERYKTLPILALPFVTYLFLDGVFGTPLQIYSDDQYGSIVRLHAVSVASLIALTGIVLAGIMPEAGKQQSSV